MSDLTTARPRVLVADPDPETSALLARQLQWAGYDVSTAGNGRDALDLINRMRPAAVVLEVKMDVLTGYEVVRRLRENPRNKLMPVIMISARAGKLDRDFAFTVGADEYVRKPFLCSDIVAKLTMLVPSPVGIKPPVLAPTESPKPITRRVRRTPVAPVSRRPLTPVPAFAGRY
jgi:two-component system, OmpR family, response regulator